MTISCQTERTYWGPHPDTKIECLHTVCPTEEELEQAEILFKLEYPLDGLENVRVKWLPPKTYITDAYGYEEEDKITATHGRWWIECSSWGGYVHERIHLHYNWLNIPMNHPGGIWLNFDDQMKETRLKTTLRNRYGSLP